MGNFHSNNNILVIIFLFLISTTLLGYSEAQYGNPSPSAYNFEINKKVFYRGDTLIVTLTASITENSTFYMSISNSHGQIVYEQNKNITNGKTVFQYDIPADLPLGNYFLHLQAPIGYGGNLEFFRVIPENSSVNEIKSTNITKANSTETQGCIKGIVSEDNQTAISIIHNLVSANNNFTLMINGYNYTLGSIFNENHFCTLLGVTAAYPLYKDGNYVTTVYVKFDPSLTHVISVYEQQGLIYGSGGSNRITPRIPEFPFAILALFASIVFVIIFNKIGKNSIFSNKYIFHVKN